MILYITRKYPPAIGGMENLNYHLALEFKRRVDTRVIAWGGSQIWLPVFVTGALVRALAILWTRPVQCIHIGDVVLLPLGLCLRFLTKIPVYVTAHGLDVTFSQPLYQFMIRRGLKRLDGVVCNSEYTRSECLKRGVRVERCVAIHPGVAEPPDPDWAHQNLGLLETMTGQSLAMRRIVLSVGRLVERKGVMWFVREVMPGLVARCPDVMYLVVGDGPQRTALENAIGQLGLKPYVSLLGKVDHEVLHTAYACAAVFIMPNIVIAENPEGAGLTTLEARAAGTPVIAADLQGIGESIAHGFDGLLIPPGDADGFLNAVLGVLNQETTLLPSDRIRARILETASWSSVATRYLEQFEAWGMDRAGKGARHARVY